MNEVAKSKVILTLSKQIENIDRRILKMNNLKMKVQDKIKEIDKK